MPKRFLWVLTRSMLLLTLLAISACVPADDQAADLLVTNGRVYSLNWGEPSAEGEPAPDAPYDEGWHPDAEAVAVKHGRVIFVGTSAEAQQFRGTRTRVLDVDGATVLPGFVDTHVHIAELGRLQHQVDLLGVETEAEAIERVAERARGVPPGEWIIGWGWDEGEWANRYPTSGALTDAFPENPVVLRSLHGFAVWGNRMALNEAGITAETPDFDGGRILRDSQGVPNGVLLDRAVPMLIDAIPVETPEQTRSYVLAGSQTMAVDGYVAIHEAGAGSDLMRAFTELRDSGELPVRVYAMLRARDEALCREWQQRGPSHDHPMLVARSVKAFYDAALGSRGARLLEDYSDTPGHRGVSGSEYGFDSELVADMMRAGFQVGVHAIGDAGNRETLEFIEGQIAVDPHSEKLRHRIEHAQVVHPEDFSRFADASIVAAMQPPHCVEDMSWAEDRLGPERTKGAYAWRTMRRAGVALAFGSDLSGSDHSIFYGLHSAITRQDKNHTPPGGWYPEQAMTPEEAVRGYTSWAAYAAHLDELTGVLRPGMWADISIIDLDPFVVGESDPGRLLDGRVVATIVDGKIAHQTMTGGS